MSESPPIHGHCEPQFEPVRAAFAANFAQGAEVGASVAVTLDGKPVVDLWAGDAADGNGEQPASPWKEDTIVNVYSTTKTMAGLCMLMIADRGLIDFDAPVATYWPEFAANGKEGVLVRHMSTTLAAANSFRQRARWATSTCRPKRYPFAPWATRSSPQPSLALATGGRPRFPPLAVSATPGRSLASTAPWPAAVRLNPAVEPP